MLSRLLSKSRISLLAFLLAGCTHIPSVPVCVEESPVRGFCTETIEDKDYVIDEQHPVKLPGDDKPKTWWERRPYMLLMPASSWAELKAYIIKQCKRTNCDQYVASWERTIMKLNPEGK